MTETPTQQIDRLSLELGLEVLRKVGGGIRVLKGDSVVASEDSYKEAAAFLRGMKHARDDEE